MGILVGLTPWIAYWVLIGNVPFVAAGLAALVLAVAGFTVGRVKGRPGKALDIGAIATFVVLTIVPLATPESFAARWVQPLSILAILLTAVIGAVTGKPLAREFAEAGLPAQVTSSEAFRPTTTLVDSIWLAALAGMSVSAVVPLITRSDATPFDADVPLSYLCFWLIPFLLLGTVILTDRVLIDRMVAEATDPHVVRRSTFVAFKELGIDELLYLAKEKADREAGAGMEAYAVQVGGKGIPLTGDESRQSWPVSYKARERV
jgi:hypothetical protein